MTDQMAPPHNVFVVPDKTSDLKPEGHSAVVRFQVAVQGEQWQRHYSELSAAIDQVDQFACEGYFP